MANQLFQGTTPGAQAQLLQRYQRTRWLQRVLLAAKGQWYLFRKAPVRYIVDAVVPFGGIFWDVFLTKRNIFVEWEEGRARGGGKNLLQVFAENWRRQQEAFKATGLPTAPLLFRPFTPAFWNAVKERKGWTQQQFEAFYKERAKRFGAYWDRITLEQRASITRTQRVIASARMAARREPRPPRLRPRFVRV